MSFYRLKYILSFILKNFESVISFKISVTMFQAVKEFHKFIFYILIYRATLRLLFVGNQERKKHFNVYQQSKFRYTHCLFFQRNINFSSHFQKISTRIGAHIESNILTYYLLVNPNNSVYPISLQQYGLHLGVYLL